jgi:hypothetical protein
LLLLLLLLLLSAHVYITGYGDQTSFMGSGSDLQMPNAMKYRVSVLE